MRYVNFIENLTGFNCDIKYIFYVKENKKI